MYNFFDFCTAIPKECAFKNFGVEHILGICVTFFIVYLGLVLLKRLSPSKQDKLIKFCAVLVPIVEISHNIWLYIVNHAKWVELLSLHLCGLQMYFIPLAVFTKALVFKDFVFATSILGGIFAIIFPSGVSDVYPFWHFQTLQTLLYHGLLIFVPIAILVTTNYRPTLKRFHKVLGLFLAIASVDLFVDLSFGQNYLFLVTSPDMPLLRNIQLNYGTIPYLIFTFSALLLICLCLHIPFDLQRKRDNCNSKSLETPSRLKDWEFFYLRLLFFSIIFSISFFFFSIFSLLSSTFCLIFSLIISISTFGKADTSLLPLHVLLIISFTFLVISSVLSFVSLDIFLNECIILYEIEISTNNMAIIIPDRTCNHG